MMPNRIGLASARLEITSIMEAHFPRKALASHEGLLDLLLGTI